RHNSKSCHSENPNNDNTSHTAILSNLSLSIHNQTHDKNTTSSSFIRSNDISTSVKPTLVSFLTTLKPKYEERLAPS
ncbi:MAG: hypothetical protein V2I33_20805, partial [Kangiellaceae bacterium]|nr:hypothetical protein [Kangiellaceae bacterium]